MTKEESLNFLQATIDKLEKATDEEIKTYEQIYDESCRSVEGAEE